MNNLEKLKYLKQRLDTLRRTGSTSVLLKLYKQVGPFIWLVSSDEMARRELKKHTPGVHILALHNTYPATNILPKLPIAVDTSVLHAVIETAIEAINAKDRSEREVSETLKSYKRFFDSVTSMIGGYYPVYVEKKFPHCFNEQEEINRILSLAYRFLAPTFRDNRKNLARVKAAKYNRVSYNKVKRRDRP